MPVVIRNTKMKFRFLFIILFSQFSYGQKCLSDSLFKRFRNDIEVELLRSRKIDWDDETKESYYTLMSNCPIDSLTKYLDDTIPAVRCLIFAGLAQRNADNAFLGDILSKHQNDTAQYVDSPTDVTISWSVKEFMQTILRFKKENKIPNEAGNYNEKLKNIRKSFNRRLPGESHGFILKDSLLVVDSLKCFIDGFKIDSFTLYGSGKKFKTSNFFTKEIKQFIRTLKSGDTIFIDDIIVEDVNKNKRRIESLALVIK